MKRFLLLSMILLLKVATVGAQTIKGNYAIKNVQTGLLLRVKDASSKDGTPLVAYSPENWKCMTWNFKHVEGNTYQLQNLFTGKTFEPAAADSVRQQTALYEQPLAPKKDQQYEFIKEGNSYLIRLQDTDLYLSSPRNEAEVNAGIILAKKNGSAAQRWVIYTQHPTM